MSHFSFTRNLYDNCALDKKNKESTAPFEYQTDVAVIESKESCFQGAAPFQHNPFRSIPVESVDIESDLRGQNLPNSKCPIHKFNPMTAKTAEWKIKECENDRLVPEYTRMNKGCNIFAGITINRFHPLCEDLQSLDKIHSNTYTGTNTRLQVKDAFKANDSK
ncbi:MAG: hypothetical protein EBU90_04110 [Proteobacteria bacterium]|nr:hypothetical protein [Pseudomonadota bacterium]NBP13923.1 hypothetical protein [bacterium]